MTKILNHINTYADLTAYDNDKDKNYPNIAYIIETNEVKWVKENLYIVVCKYNVTSTSEATKIINSSTGITYQIIDDVKQDTVQYTYTFDTLGEHTVKYKLDGTSIADYAFDDCVSLTSITIPNSVTEIGIYALKKCSALTNIVIPNSVTSIADYAFYYCTGLTSITIPDSVISIGNHAFYNTPWYNNQPDGIVYAGKVAYGYKGTMPENTSITFEDGTLGIADNAFENCTSLTSVTIPNSVISIGNYAFYYCTGLTSITIPDSVISIGNHAFYNCTSFTSVEIPNSVTSIGDSAFDSCDSLTSVTIPNSVTEINSNAFSQCTSLTSVIIPNSVTSIGSGSFRNCIGLTSVEIGNSVTEIGSYAFWDCRALTSITINATTPPSLGTSAFSETNNCPIYVPAESVNAYKNANNWSSLASRIQEIPAV